MSTQATTVEHWLDRMTDELRAAVDGDPSDLLVVGIHTGGVRIAQALQARLGLQTALGRLSITFYRDDFDRKGLQPRVQRSELPFAVDDRTILLVDDVLYSGRTVRAALNELFDYGRPERVLLAVLAERSGHELPIRADVAGTRLDLAPGWRVRLNQDDLGFDIVAADSGSATP